MLGSLRSLAWGVRASLAFSWRYSRAWLLGSLLCAAALSAVPALQVVSVKWLTDSVHDGWFSKTALISCVLVVSAGQFMGPLNELLRESTIQEMHLRYQDVLLSRIERLSPQELADPGTTAAIQACRSALNDLAYHAQAVLLAGQGLATAVTLVMAIWRLSPLASILVLGSVLPLLIVFGLGSREIAKRWEPIGAAQRRVGYAVEQLVTQRTATELALFRSGGRLRSVALRFQGRVRDLHLDIVRLFFVWNIVAGICSALMLAGAMLDILKHADGASGVAAGIVGVVSGLSSMRQAGDGLGRIISLSPKLSKFLDFVEHESVSEFPVASTMLACRSLRVSNLTIRYPRSIAPAVSGVDLEVSQGQIVAIVGANGAGKSSLVNGILGISSSSEGRVFIDECAIGSLGSVAWLKHFGVLWQEFGRYEFTVRECLEIGLEPAVVPRDAALWEALEKARVADVVRGLPGQLDAQLGEQWGGSGLSGGQWQRLSLARIYLRDAPILILDEPTSAIDAETEETIFDELRKNRRDKITIVISHRAWTLRHMDRVYMMDDGVVSEVGSYEELMSAGGRFVQLFRGQQM